MVRFFYFHYRMITKSVVLHIPSWFPNDEDPFAGDFIVRHMQAIQATTPILSVHFIKNSSCSEIQLIQHPDETVPYLELLIPEIRGNKYLRNWRAHRQQKEAVKICCAYLKVHDIKVIGIHSHVLHPAANIAYEFKKQLKCPWIHSEHWSALTKENGEFNAKSNLFKHFYKTIIQKADVFTFVSSYLQHSFEQHFKIKGSKHIISNTVDTSHFYLNEANWTKRPFRFLHVSSLGEVKQSEAIIKAFIAVNPQDSELWLVGGTEEKNNSLRESFNDDRLQFLTPQTYEAIALLMQDSDVLVLNSLYETQSCVAIEALCCGLPVLAPKVAALPEFLSPENSILFEEGQIMEAMQTALSSIKGLDNKKIAAQALDKYSYSKIGSEFKVVYNQLGIL